MWGLVFVVPVLTLLLLSQCQQSSSSPLAPSTAIEPGLLYQRIDRRNAFIPAALLELYKNHSGQDVDATLPRDANTVRYFTHTDIVNDFRFTQNDRFRLYFNMSNIPEGERLTAAELRLSALPVDRRRGPHLQRVLVNDIVHPGVEGESEPIVRLVDSKLVDSTESISLDILPASKRWRQEPSNNHGLLVVVEAVETPWTTVGHQSHIRLRRSSDDEEKDWLETQPMLLVYSHDVKNKKSSLEEMLSRTKRASSMSQGRRLKREADRDSCRRHPLFVNFTDIGWDDWIVAPPGYEAYSCQGGCHNPLSEHLDSTNHAVMVKPVELVNPNAVTKTGCVPIDFSPLSILYLDQDKVILKLFRDMVVRVCGCPVDLQDEVRVVMI